MSARWRRGLQGARNLWQRLVLIPATLRLIWAASGYRTLVWAGLLVVLGLMPAALVSMLRLLTNAVFELLRTEGATAAQFAPTLRLTAITAGLMVGQQLLQSVMNWVRTVQGEVVQDHLRDLVQQRAIHADLAFFESADYHDRLYQASKELTGRPLALLESLGSTLQSGITLVALGTLLIPYGFWLPVVLLIAALPAFIAVNHNNRRYHDWWQGATADRRWLQYYETMMTVDSIAAELRLYDLGPYFRSMYQTIRMRLRVAYLRLSKEQAVLQFLSGMGALVVSGAAMLWMLWRATQGMVSAGDIVLFYQALNRGQSQLQSLVSGLNQIQRHTLYLESLFDFLELEPQVADPAVPVAPPSQITQGIRLRNVTFRYPGAEQNVFEDFNLTIPTGKIVAIVGFNGAGKSTLVKLLCRFYDPQSGSVEIDGVDVRAMRLADLRRLYSCMFQFPVPYISTVEDNIAFGDVALQHDQTAIRQAAVAAGADEFIERLPQGYATLLGKLFPQGTQLSGGEWQRLALARAFFRQGQVMVLDEPTSSMDLWSEIDWFERFRRLANGRTSLLITHRFLTAMRADLIYVLDHGQIVQAGTHAELIVQDGLYVQAWRNQQQGVQDDNVQDGIKQDGIEQNGSVPDGASVINHPYPTASAIHESISPVG